MRKSLPICFLFAFCLFLLTNFKYKEKSLFLMMVLNEEPNLPSTPFDYKNIEFPEHLLEARDTIETGYETEGIDTNSFKTITDDKATLGRVLFYDQKLSAFENISCSSCHNQSLSFTENKSFSEGISAPTKRNSLQLNDIGWSNNNSFFWDMSETDLHTMIRLPLTDDNEIGVDINDIADKLSLTTYYPLLFERAFGSSFINEERIVDALVQFIKSMNTFDSRFDQEASTGFDGFTEAERNGLKLFGGHCNNCHSQGSHSDLFGEIIIFSENEPLGGNNIFLEIFPFIFNNGLPEDEDDKGAGEWDEQFNNLFKIPTLRNIELTGPYMHDGRFSTLEEVLDHYSDGVEANEWSFFIPGNGFNFSNKEKSDLIAFLKTLTDDSFLTEEKWSDPFEASSNNKNPGFNNLLVKPNPMDDRTVISFENDGNELVSVNVLSADGRLIEHFKTNSNNVHFDKADFNSGLYFIQLIMGDRRSTQKLVVR